MQFDREIWEKKIKKEKIIWKENCPFCKIEEDEKKLLIFESDFWQIRYNKYPYAWIKKHILVIPKRHVEFSKDLSKEELKDLKNIHNFLYNFYSKKEYFCFSRETFEGRSIKHLHYHFFPWNIYSNEFALIFNNRKNKIWKT